MTMHNVRLRRRGLQGRLRRDPAEAASRRRRGIRSAFGNFGERDVHRLEDDVGLGLREYEGWSEADGGLACAKNKNAAAEHRLHECVALRNRELLRLAIPDKLDSNHQPDAANVANERM